MQVKMALRKIIAYTSVNKNVQIIDHFVILADKLVRQRGKNNEKLLLDYIRWNNGDGVAVYRLGRITKSKIPNKADFAFTHFNSRPSIWSCTPLLEK
tara:strand:+ start:104 stop:394 length:291 start_codon:yes stop_codon:yes gene_type:complete